MFNKRFTLLLDKLSSDYYQNRLGFDQYRAQRAALLDQMDREMNGDIRSDTLKDEPDIDPTVIKINGNVRNSDHGS